MIPVQYSECQSGEKLETSAGERTGKTMTLTTVATSALNVKVVHSKQARVNDRSNRDSFSCGLV